MSFKNITQLIGITGIKTKKIIPTNSIRIVRGGGYAGSWYYANFDTSGQWYADETPISGATTKLFVMLAKYEGKKITFRSGATVSNEYQFYIPSMTNGLIAWFDAFDLGVPAANMQNVYRWNNKVNPDLFLKSNTSGDGGVYPTLTVNNKTGLPTLYGNSYYDFWGNTGNGYMSFNDVTKLPNGTSPSHVFAVAYFGKARFHTGNYNQYSSGGLIGWGYSNNYRDHIFKSNNSPGIRIRELSVVDNLEYTPVSFNQQNAIVSSFVNGAKAELSANGLEPYMMTKTSNTDKRVGYVLRGVGTSPFAGSVQDILIFNRKVNAEHSQLIEGYMAHKWKLTDLLEDDHPYKINAPLPPVHEDDSYTITVQAGTGSGYTGSIYEAHFDEPGQWFADGAAIPGATNFTFTMTPAYEGKIIEFRSENYTSNQIQLFIPRSVPGLISWLDAYDPSTLVLSGSQVTTWNSKINNNSVGQATASFKPTYSVTGRNNKPAITTNGTTQFMTWNTNKLLPVGNNPSHVFTVSFMPANATGADRYLMWWGGTANANARLIFRDSGNRASLFSANQSIVSPNVWLNNDLIISSMVTKDPDNTVHLELGINGSAPLVNNSGFDLLNSIEGTGSLFRKQDTNSNYWMGSIQEILVYENEINTSDRIKIEGYLAHKWGLVDKLPVDHRYKVNPPTQEVIIEQNSIGVYSGNGQSGSLLFANFSSPGQWYIDDTPLVDQTDFYLEVIPQYEGRSITFKTETLVSNAYIIFDPIFTSGMIGWLDALDNETIELDENNFVSRWESKTSNGLFVYQPVQSAKPLFDPIGRNERPAIISDGVNDYLDFNDINLLPMGTNPSHTFIVSYYSNVAINNWNSVISYGSNSTGNWRAIGAKTNTGVVGSNCNGIATDMVSTKSWHDQDHITATFMSSGDSQLWVDGDVSVISTGAINTTGTTARMFKDIANINWNGSVQEILMYNSKLRLSDIQRTEGYLAHKWNLTDKLPNTHPYKKLFPTLPVALYDVKNVQLISGTGGIDSIYFTKMRGGQWYFNGNPTGITGYYIKVTKDHIGGVLHYSNGSIQTTQIYIPGIPLLVSDIASLAADFDASNINKMTKDANNLVSQWNSNTLVPNAVQTTNNYKPVYQPHGLDGSRPTITGDGVDDFLGIASGIAVENQSAFAIIRTIDNRGSAWYISPGIWGGEASGIVNDFAWGITGGKPFYGAGGAGDITYVSTNAINDNNSVLVGFDRTSSNGAINHYTNGSANGSFASGITGPRTAAINSGIFSITNTQNPNINIKASISELVIFNQVLSLEERQQVEGILAWKWGTANSLPIGHPYKTALPEQEKKIKMVKGLGGAGSLFFTSFTTSGQWYADGVAVPGETNRTMVLTQENIGKTITFRSGSEISNELVFDDWTPLQLSANIVSWLDASDETTIVKNGANQVTRWNSKVGSLYVQQNDLSKAPIYNATGRNGLPCIIADGVNDNMSYNSATGFPTGGNSSFEGAVAYHNNTNHGSWRLLTFNGIEGTGQLRSIIVNPSINGGVTGGGVQFDAMSNISWLNQDHLVLSHISGSGAQVYIDGSITTNSSNTAGFNTGVSSSAYLFSNPVSAGLWPGSIQEYVIFNRNLTLDERQKFEGYLAWKWNLVSKLPANHPYKTFKPSV